MRNSAEGHIEMPDSGNQQKGQKRLTLFSVFSAGKAYVNSGYKNFSGNYRIRQRRKIIYHIFKNPFFAIRWFRLIESPQMKYIFSHRPRLYIKPFRPYIAINWSKERKVKVITDTYRFLGKFQGFLQSFLTSDTGIPIAKPLFGQENEGVLKWGYDDRFRKEGEMVLWLESERLGGKIFSVAFSFEEQEQGKWICWVGCVQGHGVNEQYATKQAQKQLFGMRPGVLVLNALQVFCNSLGISDIYAVGDKLQSYRRKHAIHLQWVHKIHFDYDKFWQEIGGKPVGKNIFRLPLIPERKSLEQVKSNKRSMYRKRFRMLDDLFSEIKEFTAKYPSNQNGD